VTLFFGEPFLDAALFQKPDLIELPLCSKFEMLGLERGNPAAKNTRAGAIRSPCSRHLIVYKAIKIKQFYGILGGPTPVEGFSAKNRLRAAFGPEPQPLLFVEKFL
jgi:hypothetical protein